MAIPTFTTRWFYHHLAGGQVEFGRHTCAVCGLPTTESVPLKKILRKTFTDYDVLRVRNGVAACPACEWYFNHQELRRSGWWLTQEQAAKVAKQEWLALLRAHIRSVGTGYENGGYYLIKLPGLTGKHLALLAPMSETGGGSVRVQFDVTTLELDARWLELVEASHRLRDAHSWKEIEQDHYVAAFTRRWGSLAEFVRLREIVKPWVGTAHLALAKYVWSKERGEEGVGEKAETDH